MNDRARKAVIFLPILGTLIIAAVIGGLIVIQDHRQAAQIQKAEAVAQDYLSDVATFRTTIVGQISKDRDGDPGRLRKIVDKALAAPPTLPDAPSYGRNNSSAYAEASRAEASLTTPYRRLSHELAAADVALDFVRAAQKALGLRASNYIGPGLITDSSDVRSTLIPAFVEARDTFDKARVPSGQDALAAKVRGAVQYVIDQATLLADRVDARQSFSFTYNQEFQAAADAVNNYATTVRGDLTEAINSIADDS